MKRLLILFAMLAPVVAQANLGTDTNSPKVSESTRKIIQVLGQARGVPLSEAETNKISTDYNKAMLSTRVASASRAVENDIHVLACVGAEGGAELGLGLDLATYICAEWGHLYFFGVGGAAGLGAGLAVQAGAMVIQAPRGEDITGTYMGGRAGAAFKFGVAGMYMNKDSNPNDEYILDEDLDPNRWMVMGLLEMGYQANMVQVQGDLMHFQIEFKFW